jgi:diguanylate cyclase (GGDEF)-like protein
MWEKIKEWLEARKKRYWLELPILLAILGAAYDSVFGENVVGKRADDWIARLGKNYEIGGYGLAALIAGWLWAAVSTAIAWFLWRYHVKLRKELEERNRALEEESKIDPLTKLPNNQNLKAAFEERIKDKSKPFCLCYVDVVGFGAINGRINHTRANAMLIELTKVIASDLRARDKLFRIHGDEFVILFNDAPVSGARAAARRISALLRDTDCFVGKDETDKDIFEKARCRFGITDFDFEAGDDTLAKCVDRADTAVNLLKARDPKAENEDNLIRIVTRADVDAKPSLLAPRRPYR